jgi:hypothetical protein
MLTFYEKVQGKFETEEDYEEEQDLGLTEMQFNFNRFMQAIEYGMANKYLLNEREASYVENKLTKKKG